MGLLRWVAIVVPMLFIVAVDILRQTVFSHHPYVFPGYAGLIFTYVITLVAIAVFSYAIFGVIGRLQRSIVERNRLSQLQNQELEALLAAGKAVTSSLDQDELLSTLLDTVVRVTSAQAAEVWLMETEEELTLRCHRGSHREAFLERTSFGLGEGIPGLVAQSREPMVIHDLLADSRFLRQAVTRAGFHTFYAQPLHYQTKLVGVLTVAAMEEDALGEAWEMRLLEGIGEWLAIALENTRLYQQVQDIAVLQERERIAREMHDGIAQLLGYINTQTIAVRKLLSDKRVAESQEELTKMEEISRDLYADVREGILGLRSPALRREGLIPALRDYAERYTEMSGVVVDIKAFSGNGEFHMTPPVEVQLIRIVQEALSNVRKHAKASAVTVEFDSVGVDLHVTITDDGQGFDPARMPSASWPRFGLQTMRERAESLGGTLNIDTSPGKGTKIDVRIPLSGSELRATG